MLSEIFLCREVVGLEAQTPRTSFHGGTTRFKSGCMYGMVVLNGNPNADSMIGSAAPCAWHGEFTMTVQVSSCKINRVIVPRPPITASDPIRSEQNIKAVEGFCARRTVPRKFKLTSCSGN